MEARLQELKEPQVSREFSNLGVEFCAAEIPWPGQPGRKLVPDSTKAYCQFEICFSWPVRTAYGAAFHPGTLANSADSMLHQVFNRAHKMKSYAPKEQRENAKDENFGAIVGVEFGQKPMGGWKINSPQVSIKAAAVMHKQVSFVPKLLGEHLGGRHKWAVSQECVYNLLESGFVVERSESAPRAVRELMDQHTPEEFQAAGLAYVPVLLGADTLCPDALLACYSLDERRVVADWAGQRVTVLKGGINGRVHFQGVGMVRYGAEKEAQIQQLLASDPDRVGEDGDFEPLLDVLKKVSESSRKLLTELSAGVLPRS